MPLPEKGNGVFPIFYFLMAKHDQVPFRMCLYKFYNDAKKLRDETPAYRTKSIVPYEVLTDMSLVIFRPCMGRF